MIDLRSNTCSRPTPEMRAAMANADVGDDVYGDDPTVKALDRATAEFLGKQNAVYVPTDTMTNQVGIRTHTEPGDAVLFDQTDPRRRAPAAFFPGCCRGCCQVCAASSRRQMSRRPRKFSPLLSGDDPRSGSAPISGPHPSPLTLSGHWARR